MKGLGIGARLGGEVARRPEGGRVFARGVSASECRATGRRHRGASPRCWTGTMRRASKVDVGLRGGSWHRNAAQGLRRASVILYVPGFVQDGG